MVNHHRPGRAPTALLQLLADGAVRTAKEVSGHLDLTPRQISNAATCLFQRGYLLRIAPGRYQLSETGLSAAATGEAITCGPQGPRMRPRQLIDSLRERAWRSMRLRKRFTVPDIVSDAGTERDRDPADNVQRYLRTLRRAGYVRELPRREKGAALTSNGFKVWMLIRDTGPRAPAICADGAVIHDFNTGEDVACRRD